jgi:preprotein translocase subunit SecF
MPIKIIPAKTNFKFVSKKWWCLATSIAAIIFTLLLVTDKGLNFGIDFTGGAIIEFSSPNANLNKIRSNLKDASIQSSESDIYIVRLPLTTSDPESQLKVIAEAKEQIKAAVPDAEFRKTDYVGPQVGGELINKAIYAMLGAFGAIAVYVWFRFEWQYAVGGLLALVHDAIITVGFYAVTGIEFNLTSVAAILTVIGYSINDSVVIYDRMRENIRKYKKMELGDMIDLTVNETLSRTMMTSTTTLIALGSLIALGGNVLSSFSWGTAFGIVIGTYSSIYVSALLLLVLDPRKNSVDTNDKNPEALA